MAEFLDQDIQRLDKKRVLIIVGSGHKLFLEDQMKAKGYRLGPSSGFLPPGTPAP